MKKEMPIADKPLPKNLPAGFEPVRWTNYGSSLLCRAKHACGRLVEFWPSDRLIKSVPR